MIKVGRLRVSIFDSIIYELSSLLTLGVSPLGKKNW